MSELVHEFLHTWESELFLLRPNDPLINLHTEQFIQDPKALWHKETKSKLLLSELKRIERERGVLPLVQFEGLLCWQKGEKAIQTPVFLTSCKNIKHQQQTLELEEYTFINPYLSLLLKEKDIQFDENLDRNVFIQTLLNCGVFSNYKTETGFANLHPQRYELRKEWEGLLKAATFSTPIREIIGDSDQMRDIQNSFELGQISPLDPDQLAAINHVAKGSAVIYGPPGTGKSVVLSNIVSSVLKSGQNALILTDKAVALSVLLGKLKEAGLQHFCVVIHEQAGLNSFYKKLQLQFEQLLQRQFTDKKNIVPSPFLAARYWQQKQALEQCAQMPLDQLLTLFAPRSKRATQATKRWLHWLKAQNALANLPLEIRTVLPILTPIWQDPTNFENLDRYQEWKSLQTELQSHQIKNQNALAALVEKSLRCIQFEANVYQNYLTLLDANTPALLKKLQRFEQLQKERKRQLNALQVWTQIPTQIEWVALKKAATQSNWLQKRKWRKLEKSWLRTANLELDELEKDLQKWWRNSEQIDQIQNQLHALGIIDLETEIGVVMNLLKHHNQDVWLWYRSLSPMELEQYCLLHKTAYRFQQLHEQLFKSNTIDFDLLSARLDAALVNWGAASEFIEQISPDLWPLVAHPDELFNVVCAEFWSDLRHHFPDVYNGYNTDFQKYFNEDLQIEEFNWAANTQQICALQQSRFDQLQALLEQPTQRLNQNEKERRKQLRKGKAILVKEMAKSRQQLSIQALFEGPASEWLRVIFPIWMSSPTALAKTLPLQTNLFDFGIFDEASQLPLSHAMGALQRVNQIVVAGDPQQMRPQSYFGQSKEGVVDLLHQAAFYLPRLHLRHHYRSEDPALIAFSNQKFYNNELLAWPSLGHAQNGIFNHFVPNGVYANQQNLIEAKAVAKQLRTLLTDARSFGVVAFSEAQLDCIYQQLNGSEQALLEARIVERSAFFLPLEQVQGEECDLLLISFGFAKNEEGKFSLRLGPMVQSQSGRRLNVLLTRAKKALHFYCSIQASDFPIKRSDAVERLWEWFIFLENGCKTQAIHKPEERLAAAQDYATFLNYYRVLKQRGTLPSQV